MEVKVLHNALIKTLDVWITSLEQYDVNDLQIKPSMSQWSVGQLYMHLLDETRFFVSQIEICLSNTDNMHEEMTPGGKAIFENNSFPDEKIKGDPVASQCMPQAESKTELLKSFSELKAKLLDLIELLEKNPKQGKTKHPGQGYLNGSEWFQYIEMHLRHHLKQKTRLDEMLKQRKERKPA
jgi:hypothetical protein